MLASQTPSVMSASHTAYSADILCACTLLLLSWMRMLAVGLKMPVVGLRNDTGKELWHVVWHTKLLLPAADPCSNTHLPLMWSCSLAKTR